MQMPAPHARHDRDDGDDARRAVRRPLHPRPRRLGPAGRRRLARRAVRQAADAHARVHRDRARRSWRASSRSSSQGEHYQIPYTGPGATGLGKPLKSILHGRQDIPIYTASIGPKSIEHERREIADGVAPGLVLEPGARWTSRAALDGGLREGRRQASARDFDDRAVRHRASSATTSSACRMPVKPHARALHRRHGRARQELLQRLRAAARLRGRGREDPGPVPRRQEGRGDGRGSRRARRRDRAGRPAASASGTASRRGRARA